MASPFQSLRTFFDGSTAPLVKRSSFYEAARRLAQKSGLQVSGREVRPSAGGVTLASRDERMWQAVPGGGGLWLVNYGVASVAGWPSPVIFRNVMVPAGSTYGFISLTFKASLEVGIGGGDDHDPNGYTGEITVPFAPSLIWESGPPAFSATAAADLSIPQANEGTFTVPLIAITPLGVLSWCGRAVEIQFPPPTGTSYGVGPDIRLILR